MSSHDTSSCDGSPAVTIEHLTVRRGTTVILDNVSCSIPRGRCTAILGPNGSGKTSITFAITGHLFATEGTMTVLDETIGRTDIRALRRRIGVVNPTVDAGFAHVCGAVVDAELSAMEAVLTGFFGTVGLYDVPSEAQRDEAAAALEKVGLKHRMSHRVALLSTGEKRRCLIARAMVARPELIILDEPTAGLDLRGREQVLATVNHILESPDPPTVLFITHHVEELSPLTQQVILLKDGRIVANGAPEDVITPESLTATFNCKCFVKRKHGRFWLEVLPEAWLEFDR